MTWLQLCFTCDAATATQLAELLTERGALAVSLGDAEDQPVYEPRVGSTPLWSNTRVSGLFPGKENVLRSHGNTSRLVVAVGERGHILRPIYDRAAGLVSGVSARAPISSRRLEVQLKGNHPAE